MCISEQGYLPQKPIWWNEHKRKSCSHFLLVESAVQILYEQWTLFKFYRKSMHILPAILQLPKKTAQRICLLACEIGFIWVCAQILWHKQFREVHWCTAAPSIQMHHFGSKPWRFRNVTVKLNKHTSSFFIFFSMAAWSRGSEVSVNAVKLFRVEPSHSVKDLQRFSVSSMLLSSSCSCLMVSWK